MYMGTVPLVVMSAATENCCEPVAYFPHVAFHAMTFGRPVLCSSYGPSGEHATQTYAEEPAAQKQQHGPAITYQRPCDVNMPPPSEHSGHLPWK